MRISFLKMSSLMFLSGLAMGLSSLAQTALPLGPYGSSPTTFGVDANGLLSTTGTFGTGTLSLSGAGTRMMWFPGEAAFRAGSVSGTQWDPSNIGAYSSAFGNNSLASGPNSAAFGGGSATGPYSFSIGGSATGYNSFAGGGISTASGSASMAYGAFSTASGQFSTALGLGAMASGSSSAALGGGTASGTNSVTLGGGSASGQGSVAIGGGGTLFSPIASGNYSTASGIVTTASSYASFAIGYHNTGAAEPGAPAPSLTTWVSTDPLFEIGNGASTASDALVVYKDGSAKFAGSVQVLQSGDIPMYTGN